MQNKTDSLTATKLNLGEGKTNLEQNKLIRVKFEDLISRLRYHHQDSDFNTVEKAYKVAAKFHQGQFRKSGEPYITHPIEVAVILADIGMTSPTIVAALLHDTVEDTAYTLGQLSKDFGEEIALIVDGVTKLDKIKYGKSAQSETMRKMIVAMSKDIRVLLIKLADRLHNARTWCYVAKDRAEFKAQETLEIYAPLAHRLGMSSIKWQLEELSFQTLYPKRYEEIVNLVSLKAPQRKKFLEKVEDILRSDLAQNQIEAKITSRPKNFYSIYQKMIVRKKTFDEIYDLAAVRILVDTIQDCYTVLGQVHSRWNPIPGRFKDYIAMPKLNLYQSLHTTVLGPNGRAFEVQIRTHRMHEHAEYGVAAHWRYKQNSATSKKMTKLEQLGWIKNLIELEKETGDPEEFLDSLRYEIAGNEVYVFTPVGEVKVLPPKSTPIDFAYSVHTEVGHKTVGAKINGRLVPLTHFLESGDIVEVITTNSMNAAPSLHWLDIVASSKAKSKIKAWFSNQRKEENIERGKNILAKALRKHNLPIKRIINHDSIHQLTAILGASSVDALYLAIGENTISAQRVIDKIMELQGGEEGSLESLSEAVSPVKRPRKRNDKSKDRGIRVDGLDAGGVWVRIAKCCTPVPGDEIVGFITKGKGISVHHAECLNIVDLIKDYPERFVDVSWDDGSSLVEQYLVEIEIRSLNRTGLVSDISRVFQERKLDIVAGSQYTRPDQVAVSKFTIELPSISYLQNVLEEIRQIDGVYKAFRSMQGKRK